MTQTQTGDLHFLSIAEAGRRLRSGELTVVALTEAFLARIADVDERIRSYILVLKDRAREAARKLDAELAQGHDRGPLHGIPFAVKDNYHVAGVPTTGGSRVMLDHHPKTTSTIIRKLEDAGAVLLGKLNTWEYGTGNAQVYHDLPFPVARNPWDRRRFTGGSSTGAGAAVAAGTAMFALGSDTGGSVRLPAAACGVQGLKATYGLVSRAHCLPNCWSLDHTGPFAWTVGDIALVLGIIAGADPDDTASARRAFDAGAANLTGSIKGRVIGVVRDLGADTGKIDPANAAAIEAAARALADRGAVIREVCLPVALDEYRSVARVINWAESYSLHAADYRTRGDLMGRALREKMMMGAAVSADDYLAAQRQRTILAKKTDEVVRACDVLLIANAFHVAPRFDEPDRVPPFTTDSAASVFNVTGHPALSVCTGFDSDGLPLNAQLVAPYFEEGSLLRIAHHFETSTPWRDKRPNLDALPGEPFTNPPAAAPSEGIDQIATSAVERAQAYGRMIERSYGKDDESAAVFRVGS